MVRRLLDLFFPPRCVGCSQRGGWICRSCHDSAPRLPEARCRRCATPLAGVSVCARCWRDPPPFESVTAAFLFEGTVREAIHQLKYRRARHLAGPLVESFLDVATLPPGDLIVPVPLHPDRLRARGYNQAELIAKFLANHVAIPVDGGSLARIRDTAAQVSIPPAHRWENVRGAFVAPEGSFDGRRVLLVDDVATSTSTLRAAASTVERAGASRVDAVVIARTGAGKAPGGTGVA